VVVVITGPIASGKSTLAREVARDLERHSVPTAVIDLDVVHDTLIASESMPDDAAWTLARGTVAVQANAFRENGVPVVIADGSFNTLSDREAFARHLQPAAAPVYVTLRVSYEEALRRAQDDATRGASRDPAFLGPYYVAHDAALATAPVSDLVIDTERTTVAAAAAMVVDLVRSGVR
jgi:adenylylsulfate kinase-like enzyme